MKELDQDYWRRLDAECLAAEETLAEELLWAAHDVFEGIGRIGLDEVVIVSELL